MYGNTQYFNPIIVANDITKTLRNDEKCDFIICLSHLGYESKSNGHNDQTFAEGTHDIDLIIGAHTHTFLKEPVSKKNTKSKEVLITQVGWAGIWLGRFDVFFSGNTKTKTNNASALLLDKKYDTQL